MSAHELGPELRQLAQAILDRLDPAVRAAAAMAGESLRGPGRCEQVWCPVCAVAALVNGEQHPMLGLIAEHSATVMTMVRAMADAQGGAAAESGPAEDGQPAGTPVDGADTAPSTSNRSYHDIPIVIESTDGRSA